ncbi:MerR family transcriptional regulator [Actinomadura mexicana]|uniref:DNA-binding transcriptional regulator, MerR family n=1 Tax=Actinomadura mexicana TaxID=134959 RepID=A0A238UYN2_9ACTN|nr:MerR family transcriptional regulator [Actinomadura mexicana]SNR27320.1 DNA-binding transcriptional regulator, MerR family [Actinomadura mexicana]
MRIGELARITGTTPRALRHYEEAGLLASRRAGNGYRVYDESAAVRVRNIRELLAVGLTLDDVRAFSVCLDGDVAASPPSARGLQIAQDRLAILDARISAQAEARDRLATALARASGRRPAPAR